MKRLLIIAAVLTAVFFLSCCASDMPVFSGYRDIPADFTGIVHAGGTRTNKEYAYLDYIGAKWILYTFNWTTIEPVQGEWDFLTYDAIVDRANAAGIKVLGILAYDNWWLHADKDTRKYIPPEWLPDYLQYVRKTVEHFRGRIGAWCIWNEPNFHFWKGTDEEFIELSRQAADAVREMDSEVILLGGAFNRNVTGLPEKFIRGLFESGAMDKTDAVAFHPYELNPSRTASLYAQFKKIADDYGYGEKIWVTEVGYPTGGWYPTKVSEKKFPEYVIKTCVLLAASGSNKLFWFQMFDPQKRSRGDSEDFFGLVRSRRDYTSKGAEAFRLCSVYLPGTSCSILNPAQNGLPESLRLFLFRGTDGGALVFWNEGAGSKRVHLRLPGVNHATHDPVSGNANTIQAETVIKTGKRPVFITWQGDGEPVIIR
jgi:hypothetical protein